MKRDYLTKLGPIIILAILIVSCSAPETKEGYLKSFDSFIQRVKANYREYNQSDWKWADDRFEKFSSEWYNRFKEDLSVEEKLKIAGWTIEYESLKGSSRFRDFYKKHLKDDIDKTGKDLKDFLKNDFGKGISKAAEGAKEIGDSALKVLDDLADELKKVK